MAKPPARARRSRSGSSSRSPSRSRSLSGSDSRSRPRSLSGSDSPSRTSYPCKSSSRSRSSSSFPFRATRSRSPRARKSSPDMAKRGRTPLPPPKRASSRPRVSGPVGDEAAPMQAVVLTDCIDQTFFPMSIECPKVLLPLVDVPLIDYTLDWLQSSGVRQVFMVSCDPDSFCQIEEYLRNSGWLSEPGFDVLHMHSREENALLFIYKSNVIRGDFILVTGDVVSNMLLSKVLQEHKDRRKKDPLALMTMVINTSLPNLITRKNCLGTPELFMTLDFSTEQLLSYKFYRTKHVCQQPSVEPVLHNDMQDCCIDICAPEMLKLFLKKGFFNWQHHRVLFVQEMLDSDIQQCKIFTHKLELAYAARAENLLAFASISQRITRRWRRPYDPFNPPYVDATCKLKRQEMFRVSGMETFPRDCIIHSATRKNTRFGDNNELTNSIIGEECVTHSNVKILGCYLGNHVTIGENTKVSSSVIGEGCFIGSNVSIEGCYMWSNVTVADGCKLKDAWLCDGVILKSRAVLNRGVVLSFKVIVGEGVVVPEYSKVSLLQPVEVEVLKAFAKHSNIIRAGFIPTIVYRDLAMSRSFRLTSEVGADGDGCIWSIGDESLHLKYYWEHPWPPSVSNGDYDDLYDKHGLGNSIPDDIDYDGEDEHIGLVPSLLPSM